jgi:hypothetical protein
MQLQARLAIALYWQDLFSGTAAVDEDLVPQKVQNQQGGSATTGPTL